MTVCTPWVTEDDLTDDEGCGARLADVDPTLVARGLAIAQEVLFRLSGERWAGLCSGVVRPCGQRPPTRGWRSYARCANGLSDLEARLMAVTQQITAIERTIVGKLDSTDDT